MKKAIHLTLFIIFIIFSINCFAQKIEVTGPAGSGQFGAYIKTLPNGNYVIVDYEYDDGAITNAGAVYLYNGSNHSLISTLKGTSANDQVGRGGIIVLADGNFVIDSWMWDGNKGAITYCNAATGLNGTVDASNSLVGANPGEGLGIGGVLVLSNGNYVSLAEKSATWCNKNGTTTGLISTANSLLSNYRVSAFSLPNGNYVVTCPDWFNDVTGAINAGAVVWCNGTTGYSGTITTANSLHGTHTGDSFPRFMKVLTNGNYVLSAETWDNGTAQDVGIVKWCPGNSSITGDLSPVNSLIGANAYDRISDRYLYALSNGNYVVGSTSVTIGSVPKAGAATWCSGTGFTTGVVSALNSLVGAGTDDLSQIIVTPLTNGNYVVSSYTWNNGSIAAAGTVTWCNGTVPTSAIVSTSNSVYGTTQYDFIGGFNGVAALPNGNYFILSPYWDNGAVADAGAITWCDGTVATSGAITAANSLIGQNDNDRIGSNFSGVATANNDFIVSSPYWNNGAIVDAGAVTLINGATGITGNISTANSLCGSSTNDRAGIGGITYLPDGNAVICSPYWNNGAVSEVGAATLLKTGAGTSGTISTANSITGSQMNDHVGNVTYPFPGGSFALRSPDWNNGANTYAGAVTWLNGSVQTSGDVNTCNSVTGSVARPYGNYFNVEYNSVFNYLLVANYNENKIIAFNPSGTVLTTQLSTKTVNIIGNEEVSFIDESNCGLIATVKQAPGQPVTGNTQATAWIEPSVPLYLGQPFAARHFEITPASNTATSTARITLYFTQQEFTDFNNHPNSFLNLPANPIDAAGKANLRVGKYSGISNDGTGLPGSYTGSKTVIDPDDNDINWNSTLNRWEVSFNVTGFSGFIVQTSGTVLPLQFLSFNAQKCNTNQACLNWKTANEQNVSHFEIERSLDGKNFAAIKTVQAKSQSSNQYAETDVLDASFRSKIFYRLKQFDNDGKYTYSEVRMVEMDDKIEISIYPNPANEFIKIMGRENIINLKIMDEAGRVFLYSSSIANNINVSKLSKGIYIVSMQLKDGTIINQKLIII